MSAPPPPPPPTPSIKVVLKTVVSDVQGNKWEEQIYSDGTTKRIIIGGGSLPMDITAPDTSNWKTWHGQSGNKDWAKPYLVAQCNAAVRMDQGNSIKANEYVDTDDVLNEKIKIVASLIKSSKYCVAYTGAGLSRSSGIPDYASKASNSIVGGTPKLTNPMDALPTRAHCVITLLERTGYIHDYVQQNHDGLPQKSGFPQHKMNEIHGAWYDPSNPVVQFGRDLRRDLFESLMKTEQEVDLCLCLGTSLSGMNADRIATTAAHRFSKMNTGHGTVIINLQQTPLDDHATIRVWAKLDDAFTLLLPFLQLDISSAVPIPRTLPSTCDIYEVPYNENGFKDHTRIMLWDLRKGAKVKVALKDAQNFGAKGVVDERKEYHYMIWLEEKSIMNFPQKLHRAMGVWWVEEALSGKAAYLPVVNIEPLYKV
eukprot:TRINITY_DN1678_c0_g3_i1.p1 TRINITY_DN1678_c0_g3~~TRINITY_DN1678_c0_g3_i1.p1  ORF type:complete len:439 (+),score=86.61 TRINITY_DN1678_c0_g3_i1:44-1318(+)